MLKSDVCSGDTENVLEKKEKKRNEKQWIIMAPAVYELRHYKTIKG